MLRSIRPTLNTVSPRPLRAPETPVRSKTVTGEAPAIAREFRGAWIATVQNIDWPSKPGLTPAAQQAELLAMLDKAQTMGLNAVIMQVRPNADALYASETTPWSEVLTGKMGQNPGYDPLAFAVAEAHKRGLELHAWFNPFRARQVASNGSVAPADPKHVTVAHPDWAKRYGQNIWLDPGKPEVQAYAKAEIMDVVKRYGIDAVHMDDYFYPYPVVTNGVEQPFPDAESFRAYQAGGGKLARDDWRRDNVNRFVTELNDAIHAEKPEMKFGISPFGIWKPGHPAGTTGLSQYDKLYADAKLWLEKGLVDYFVPQLYWPIEKPAQAFPALLKWWTEQNPLGRHVWAGLFTSKVQDPATPWPAKQITDQVARTRAQEGATGHVHFSSKPLMQNAQGIADKLTELYKDDALVPATPWRDADGKAPEAPEATLMGDQLTWTPKDAQDVARWVVYTQEAGRWRSEVLPADTRSLKLGARVTAVELATVDQAGLESQRARVERPL